MNYMMISHDVFGSVGQLGLVNFDNRDDFDENVSKLKTKWDQQEKDE